MDAVWLMATSHAVCFFFFFCVAFWSHPVAFFVIANFFFSLFNWLLWSPSPPLLPSCLLLPLLCDRSGADGVHTQHMSFYCFYVFLFFVTTRSYPPRCLSPPLLSFAFIPIFLLSFPPPGSFWRYFYLRELLMLDIAYTRAFALYSHHLCLPIIWLLFAR